jgi:5-methylcytosine-specific restriction endonuclease McrA
VIGYIETGRNGAVNATPALTIQMRRGILMATEESSTVACSRCGLPRKRGGQCSPCRKAYLKDWQRRNKAKRQADTRAYYEKHTEKIKTESLRYQRSNMERSRAYFQKWRDNNRTKERARLAAFAKAHPEVAKAKQARRRALLSGAGGKHTAADIRRIYAEQQGLCFYCKIPLPAKYHVDHKVPVVRGGTAWPENMCCACPPCNQRKHKRTAEEFLATLHPAPNNE